MKKIMTIIMILLMSLTILAGCSQEKDTIKIGWIGAQTGGAAILGMDGVVAAQIAVDEINAKGGIDGRPVELIIEDDKYDTPSTITSYEKLVNIDGVKLVLMQTYGSVFALSERAKRDGVIIIDPLDSNSKIADLGDHVFSVGVESESIARLLSGYAENQGYDKVGMMYFNSDTFMPYVKDVFEKEYEGETLIEAYPAGTTDFRTTLLKLNEEGVDALVLLGYDEVGNLMKQARALDIDVPFLMPGTITSPSLQEAAEGAAEGTIFTFWTASKKDQEPTKSFLAEFSKRKGREPIVDLFTYPNYDAIKALEQAILQAGTDNPEKVKIELLKVQGLNGITGIVNFESDGSVRIPFKLHKLENGAPVLLE